MYIEKFVICMLVIRGFYCSSILVIGTVATHLYMYFFSLGKN